MPFPAVRCYKLNRLSLRVTAPDAMLTACLDPLLGSLAVEADVPAEWGMWISLGDIFPPPQRSQVVWEGKLPEGLGAILWRDGTDRGLFVRDHLMFSTDSKQKRIDVIVRRGCEKTLSGTASISLVAEIIRLSGYFLVHAACLLYPAADECLLIFAPSGTGKTTTSLALARNGWRLVGDDATILEITDSGPMAWALPRALNIHRRTQELLPWMTTVMTKWGEEEVQSVNFSRLSPFIGHATPALRRCRATVLLDRPNGSAHIITRLNRREALLRMLSDNLRIAPDGMSDSDINLFDSLTRLAKDTTALRVSAGPELDTLASYIAASISHDSETVQES